MPPTYTIEPITKQEHKAILAVDTAIFDKISQFPPLTSIDQGIKYKVDGKLAGYLLYTTSVLGPKKGNKVGHNSIDKSSQGKNKSSTTNNRHIEIYIDSLGVRPKFRGQGIAGQLLKRLLAKFPRGTAFKLRVERNADHDKLVAYYGRFGFIVAEDDPSRSTVMIVPGGNAQWPQTCSGLNKLWFR